MIQFGNEIEKRYSLKLLCQLTFNKNISADVNENAEFISLLESIKSSTPSLQGLVETIFWNLKTSGIEDQVEAEKEEIENEGGEVAGNNESAGGGGGGGVDGSHIMISYNSASRQLCLKVKSYLEELGHKVWIDVSNIHGASLDAMAKAVEGIVIIQSTI